MCALTAPTLFEQDEEGRVVLLAEGLLGRGELETAREAVARCPSGALSLRGDGDDATADE